MPLSAHYCKSTSRIVVYHHATVLKQLWNSHPFLVYSDSPKNVRARIMKEAEEQVEAELAEKRGYKHFRVAPKNQLKSFLSDGKDKENSPVAFAGKPIADLFPSATVMFGDISGKSCSVEPSVWS